MGSGQLFTTKIVVDKFEAFKLEPKHLVRIKTTSFGHKCVAVTTDVTDFQSVTAMVKQSQDRLGQIGILVNSVGWDNNEPFWKNSLEFWDKLVEVNFRSIIYCSRAVLDMMMENHVGKIINIASDAGRVGCSGETVYAGINGGVIAFTKSLAREVARFNIQVN